MPFTQYGVLCGTLVSHHRDDPDDFGRWRHVNLIVRSGARTFRIAVDVDDKDSTNGVQWKRLRTTGVRLGWPIAPPPGFSLLATTATSGAIDVIRHPAIRLVRLTRVLLWLHRLTGAVPAHRAWFWIPLLRPWRSGDHLEASEALESALLVGATVLIWGEPFPENAPPSSVQGMHNVHQNQGDPANTPWWAENGIWQDGGVATLQSDGSWQVFVSKFATQSDRTDAQGHPV